MASYSAAREHIVDKGDYRVSLPVALHRSLASIFRQPCLSVPMPVRRNTLCTLPICTPTLPPKRRCLATSLTRSPAALAFQILTISMAQSQASRDCFAQMVSLRFRSCTRAFPGGSPHRPVQVGRPSVAIMLKGGGAHPLRLTVCVQRSARIIGCFRAISRHLHASSLAACGSG